MIPQFSQSIYGKEAHRVNSLRSCLSNVVNILFHFNTLESINWANNYKSQTSCRTNIWIGVTLAGVAIIIMIQWYSLSVLGCSISTDHFFYVFFSCSKNIKCAEFRPFKWIQIDVWTSWWFLEIPYLVMIFHHLYPSPNLRTCTQLWVAWHPCITLCCSHHRLSKAATIQADGCIYRVKLWCPPKALWKKKLQLLNKIHL